MDQEGKTLAYLDFSDFENEPHVQFIWVDPAQRGNGLGAALVRHLQSLYPDTEIDFGGLTDDGVKLLSSLKFKTVEDPQLAKMFRFLDRVKAQLRTLAALPPEDQITRGTEWNRLHDIESQLEQQLWGKAPTKKIVESTLIAYAILFG